MDSAQFEANIKLVESSLAELSQGLAALSNCSGREFDNISEQLNNLMGDNNGLKNMLDIFHSAQNRFCRINRLPLEVLSMIFESLVASERPQSRVRSRWRRPRNEWLKVNLVCRHWRAVALRTPGLRTYIYMNSAGATADQSLASLSLQRAGSLPLVFFCRADDTLSKSYNIRELYLRSTSFKAISPMISGNPCLTVLVVDNRNTEPSEWNEEWNAPHLETLVSSRFPQWRFGTFGNLRHLIVERPHNDIHFEIADVKRLYDVLSANPFLQDLVLNIEVASISAAELTEAMKTLSSVDMRHLRRLDLLEIGLPTVFRLFDCKVLLYPGLAYSYSFISPDHIVLPDVDSPEWTLHGFYPGKNISVDDAQFFTTDGESAFRFHQNTLSYERCRWFLRLLLPTLKDQAQYLRLFLLMDETCDALSWIEICQEFREIRTIAVAAQLDIWLAFLTLQSDLFPLLNEIHVGHRGVVISQEEMMAIVKLSIKRRRNDQSIRTVHIWNTSFDDEPQNITILAPFVENVLLEKGSLNISLPAICTEPSPAHDHWSTWVTVEG